MNKLVLASFLALPGLLLAQQQASAGSYNLAGCFQLKVGFDCWRDKGHCGHGGHPGGYGGYGGQQVGHLAAPGPWYTYWPYGYTGQQIAQTQAYPGWTYESNFNAPAPTGFPYWPAPITAPAAQGGHSGQMPAPAFQPVGYYPSYWYGH